MDTYFVKGKNKQKKKKKERKESKDKEIKKASMEYVMVFSS